jgi:hypothetical protein
MATENRTRSLTNIKLRNSDQESSLALFQAFNLGMWHKHPKA